MSRDLPWFRMYSEIISHPRVEMLSFEDQRHYVWLLCLKNEGHLDDDKMPSPEMRERSIAKKLGLDIERLRDARVRLRDMKLIDENYQPIGWDERQFLSDSSRERVARYRQRKAGVINNNNDIHVKPFQKRECNVTVTMQDTDTDNKLDKSNLSEVAVATSDADGEISKLSGVPHCPHQDIIACYLETLPELPGVILSRWTGSSGERDLKARWREDARHRSLEFWRRFFTAVRSNPHWLGGNERGWQADLRWLLKRANFDKVLDRLASVREVAHG